MDTYQVITLAAGSSVAAAFLTQIFGVIRDRLHTKRDGGYAALYLAIALESYATACSNTLGESENYVASDGHAGTQHGNLPDLAPYPDLIDWRAFGLKRTTEALSFRVEVLNTKAKISGEWEWGDEDDALPVMWEEAARLGSKAIELATTFRAAWKIDPVAYDTEWSVKKHLAERFDVHKAKRIAEFTRRAAMPDFPATPA